MPILIAVLLSWTLGQTVPTQQASPSGITVEGVVVDFQSGQPIDRAVVELRRALAAGEVPELLFSAAGITPLNPPLTVITGSDGKFLFKEPPVGEYRLYATRATRNIPAEYGQRTPTGTGTPFPLAAAQKMSGITLRMAPVGSITGRVVDADGDPVAYASVDVFRSGYQDGKRRLLPGQTQKTNDRGEYRLHSLPPGDYYITARPYDTRSTRSVPSSDVASVPNRFASRETANSPLISRRVLETAEIVEETWMPVYYPGTPDPRAARVIPLHMGESIGGIDFNLSLSPVPARRVRGTVLDGATGAPAAGALIQLTPRDPLIAAVVMPSGVADAKGVFEVPGVLPTAYSLFVSGTVSGFMVVDASGGDVNNLQIVGVKGVDVPLHVTFDEGASLAAQPAFAPQPVFAPSPVPLGALARPQTPLRVTLIREPGTGAPTGAFVITAGWPGVPQSTMSPQVQPQPGDRFLLRQVSLGDYRVSISGLAPGAFVKSIRKGQIDVLRDGLSITGTAIPENDALEIVVGANAGVLTGRVINDAGQPVPNVTVALVPNPSRRSRIDLYQSVSTDVNGAFRLQGIVPDEYKLFSWEEVITGAWHDPDFLRVHENRGVIVTVGQGNNAPQQLRMIPWGTR